MTAGRTCRTAAVAFAGSKPEIIGIETVNELVKPTGCVKSLYRRTSRNLSSSSSAAYSYHSSNGCAGGPPPVDYNGGCGSQSSLSSSSSLSSPTHGDRRQGDDQIDYELRRSSSCTTTKRSASCDRRVRGSSSDRCCISWDDPESPACLIEQLSPHSRRGGAGGNGSGRRQLWSTGGSTGRCAAICQAVPKRKLASALGVLVVAAFVFSLCAIVSSAALAVASSATARRHLSLNNVVNIVNVDRAAASIVSLSEKNSNNDQNQRSNVPQPAPNTRFKSDSEQKNVQSLARNNILPWNHQISRSEDSRRNQKPLNKPAEASGGTVGTCGPVRLRRLDVNKLRPRSKLSERTPDVIVPQNVWRRIVNTPGDRLDVLHLTVVPFVSAMQWKHDVYGTVAQLNGVGFGKLTSLLAQTVDSASGERLFVADTFATLPDAGGTNSGSGLLAAGRKKLISPYEVFAAHLRDTSGFDEHSTDPTRRLFIHRGRLDELRHNATVGSFVGELPQFRFVVVGNELAQSSSTTSPLSASNNGDNSLTALETAVCFLRDGGLIVVELSSSVDEEDETQHDSLIGHYPMVDAFFTRHGRTIIAPLLLADNKLYLTTTNFRRKYIDYISDAGDWLALHIGMTPVKMTTNSGLGGFEFLHLQ